MYSINNIWTLSNNIWTLSIKQRFQLFLCSYFESKSAPNGMKSFSIEFFINLLIVTMSKNETLYYYILYFFFVIFFLLFLSSSKRKENSSVITLRRYTLFTENNIDFTKNNIDVAVVQGDTTHKKILSLGKSHIAHLPFVFYYFKDFI